MTRPGRLLAPAAALVAAALVLAGAFGSAAEAQSKKRRRPRKPPEPTAVPRPVDPYRVTFQTVDGVFIAATWRPGSPGAPALLLVHDFGRERRAWDALEPELLSRGFATLAIDLRAHGESTRKAGTAVPLHLSPRLLGESNGFPRDVQAACLWLRERAPKVGILGLSLGGNLAVVATASSWADAAVAVSANTERLAALAGGRPTKPRGLLVLAAREDPGRAAAARALEESGEEPKRTILVPGAAHNLALLDEHTEAKEAALGWLAERLGAVPLPAPVPAVTPAPKEPS